LEFPREAILGGGPRKATRRQTITVACGSVTRRFDSYREVTRRASDPTVCVT
jgi:hypothetical protein